jgi:alkanesulfonate monooxygenase SsuD/methylene tetrahydromethanopterin reductase-like flavin-dependent oxidoreductase (luciferase family)
MKLGMLFTGAEPIDTLVALGSAAESAGFDALRMVEAYRSAWVPLTALASATSRVDLGPWVLNAYARSPFMTGLSALDFNDFCEGRLTLGLGGGNRVINEEWQGIPHEAVLTRIFEQTEILRRMANAPAGSLVEFKGKIHSIRWRAIHPPRPFPIFLAAIFPAMLRVAAKHADGIAGGATLSAEFLQSKLQTSAAKHAADAGRDPSSLRWKAVHFAAVHEDERIAHAAVRAAIAGLFHPLPHPYYAWTLREQGFGTVVDALERDAGILSMESLQRHIPLELIQSCCLAGTEETCRRRIEDYAPLLEELLLIDALPVEHRGNVLSTLFRLPAARA